MPVIFIVVGLALIVGRRRAAEAANRSQVRLRRTPYDEREAKWARTWNVVVGGVFIVIGVALLLLSTP